MKYEFRMDTGIYGWAELILSSDMDEFVIWRSKEEIDSIEGWAERHDTGGFVLMVFYSARGELGRFYFDNEKKIKEEAKLFIVKEML